MFLIKRISRRISRKGRRLISPPNPGPDHLVQTAPDVGQVYVFIRTWNRPLYLWACLDSLYRTTRCPCRFILPDNHSTDPLVKQVVEGFRRRGMLQRLLRRSMHVTRSPELTCIHQPSDTLMQFARRFQENKPRDAALSRERELAINRRYFQDDIRRLEMITSLGLDGWLED